MPHSKADRSALAAVELAEAEADYLEALAIEVELAELTAERAARVADRADKLVPDYVTRSLYPHERQARVDFLGIDTELNTARDAIVGRLQADRSAFLELLAADLEHVDGTGIAGRLLDLEAGSAQVDGVRELFDESVAFYRSQLIELARQAAHRVWAEAHAQGVTEHGALQLDGRGIELQARRLTMGPQSDLIRALREEAIKAPPEQLAADRPSRIARLNTQALVESGRSLSDKPLDSYAKSATNQAYGAGRNGGAAGLPRPARIYASELLDANTCDPCAAIDGTEYDSVEASLEDYPEGGYINCYGGDLCRGTRVFVWEAEQPPSTEFPGDTGPPPYSQGGPYPGPPDRTPHTPGIGLAPDTPPDRAARNALGRLRDNLTPKDPVFKQIPTGAGPPPPQAVIDASNRIVSQAVRAEQRISDAIRGIERNVPGELRGFNYRLKVDLGRQTPEEVLESTARIRTKMVEDLADGKFSSVAEAEAAYGDAVRYTYVFEPDQLVEGAQKTVDALRARFGAPKKFANNFGGPYIQNINSQWVDASTGQTFEVQFHTPASFDLAHGASHDWYEIARNPLQADEYQQYATDRFAELWQPVRAQVPPAAADIRVRALPTEVSWSPSMDRIEAELFARDSKVTEDLIHVTHPDNVAGITDEGFNLDRRSFGRLFGDGVYLTPDPLSAGFYDDYGTMARLIGKVRLDNPYRVELAEGEEAAAPTILEDLGLKGRRDYFKGQIEANDNAIVDHIAAANPQLPDYRAGYRDRTTVEALWAPYLAETDYIGDWLAVRSRAFTLTMQEAGYDGIVVTQEAPTISVGGSQVVVFDPKAVTIIR